MRLIVVGSRQFDSEKHQVLIFDYLDRLHSNKTITEVVCGVARGPDSIGEEWATSRGVKVAYFPAAWDTYKNAAGPIRNKQMGDYAECLVAFWDGKSRGTKHMMDVMIKQQKPYYLVTL